MQLSRKSPLLLLIMLGMFLFTVTTFTIFTATTVFADHTPDPTNVTVPGSFNSELGCATDWDPACAIVQFTNDINDDVWQGTFNIPAGAYEYKAALNNSFDENYGANAVAGGANIPLTLGAATNVKFYYDHKSHWITNNQNAVIATVPGSFQSELGCSGDWDPSCLRSWLQDPDGDGIYQFSTLDIPTGSYEAKVAINESWDENYGAGGVAGGANIPFTVGLNQRVTFIYNATTHILTIEVSGRELEVSKTNDANGAVAEGQTFTWTLTVSNTGVLPATFADSTTILSDSLPTSGLGYGTPLVSDPISVTNASDIICTVAAGSILTCAADGNPVTIEANGRFEVVLPVTPTAIGNYSNPRAGGICMVDPANVVSEDDEENNQCSDAVTVVETPVLSMTVSKLVNTTQAQVGDAITYTYRITNSSNVALTITAVDDHLGNVSGLAGALNAGLARTAILTHTVTEADLPTPLVNTVVVTGTDALGSSITASAIATVNISDPTSLPEVDQPRQWDQRIFMPSVRP